MNINNYLIMVIYVMFFYLKYKKKLLVVNKILKY